MAEPNRFNIESSMWDDLSESQKQDVNTSIEECVQSEKQDGKSEGQAIATCKNPANNDALANILGGNENDE